MEYVPLKGFNDYEIMTSYPYDIRNKTTKHKCGMVYSKRDGILININGKVYKKHRLIASQFMKEDIMRHPVYHINGDLFDNHLDNLTIHQYEINSHHQASSQRL